MLCAMSPLMNTLMKFARSRQGRRLAPALWPTRRPRRGSRQIAQAREQLAKRRRPR